MHDRPNEGTLEIHQLRYFCAVARHGTFTSASKAEHVAQPSLSQQIMKLEAELVARLFDRLPRSARLTIFGRAFLPKAERILRELDEAKNELRDMAGDEKGQVVVGIIPTIAAYLLPTLLHGFASRHPNISIKIVEAITPVLVEQLAEGTMDVAIAALPIHGGDLATEKLFDERFFAVLPVKHRYATRRSIDLAQLNSEPFLLLQEGHCFRESLLAACNKAKMSPNVVFESGQFATILAMVAAGMGVSAVPAMAVQPRTGCKYVPITGKHNARSVVIVTSRHHYQRRAQRLLTEQVRMVCQKNKPSIKSPRGAAE